MITVIKFRFRNQRNWGTCLCPYCTIMVVRSSTRLSTYILCCLPCCDWYWTHLLFLFFCSGASEEEDTWRLTIPRGKHPFPVCMWQRVCNGFWYLWKLPGNKLLPLDMSPDPQQAHMSPRDNKFYAYWVCASCSLVVGHRKSPFDQLGGLFRQLPKGCFELTQESQPLEYCASQQYHFLRKVLEYLERKSVFSLPANRKPTLFVLKPKASMAILTHPTVSRSPFLPLWKALGQLGGKWDWRNSPDLERRYF